jgi:hypothetical protein
MRNSLRQLILLLPALVVLVACTIGTADKSEKKQASDTAVRFRTSLDWEERFSGVDSVVVVFYDDPYSADSLRYTRFYKQISLKGEDDIKVVRQQLGEIVHQKEYMKGCRSEGKIWCFEKGSIRQTLYFNTGAQNCTYVYFIKDGNFFYSMPNAAVKEWLQRNKSNARKPEGSVE